MSVDAFSALPVQAGLAVAAAAGRTAKLVVGAYLKAPLRNTAIAALTTFSAMAGSNALYHQTGHHPAPLFGSFKPASAARTGPAEVPPLPLQRPAKLSLAAPETTGSVQAAPAEVPAATPIGNEDVFEIQRRLTAFEMFDGKLDGLYGPRTARAIKTFQASVGLQPTGELTPEIVNRIKSTSITAAPVETNEVATPASSRDAPSAEPEAAPSIAEPLPAPEPLLNEVATDQQVLPEAVASNEPGVSSLEMTSPPSAAVPTKRTVQTIAVRASAPEDATAPNVVTDPIDVVKAATDPKVVGAIQRGLASLGFLHGEIDGVAGEATAKAIRNFEVYYNYNVTGRITPELVNLLVQNGAVI